MKKRRHYNLYERAEALKALGVYGTINASSALAWKMTACYFGEAAHDVRTRPQRLRETKMVARRLRKAALELRLLELETTR